MNLWRRLKRRRPVLLSLLVAVALMAGVYAGAVTFIGTSADTALIGPGTQLLSTGTGGQAGEGGQAPAVSADGRYAVFQSKADLPSLTPLHERTAGDDTWRVYGRDLTSGVTTLLSDPAVDATDPQVSANGRRVTYRTTTRLLHGLTRATTVVVDRDVSGGGRLDIDGNVTASDFADGSAEPDESFPGLCRQDCGPKISADGSTVVYPSVTSPISPDFVVSVGTGDGSSTPDEVKGNMIDINAVTGIKQFDADDPPVDVIVGTKSVVPGQESVDFTGSLTIEHPYGSFGFAFQVGPKACDDYGTCRSTLTFSPERACFAEANQPWDRLVIDGPTSAGHSSVLLKANCGPKAFRTFCTPQPGTNGFYEPVLTAAEMGRLPVRQGKTEPSQVSGNQIALGAISAGNPYLVAVPTLNLRGEVAFANPDCAAIKLVDPGPEARATAAKLTGADPTAVGVRTRLDGTDRGTLYFLINPPFWPESVRQGGSRPLREPVYAAELALLSDDGGPPQGGFTLTVHSVRQIIESRRDTSDSGGFAPGPAELVSRGVYGGGYTDVELVDGAQPSVSADGSRVAYTTYRLPEAGVNQPVVVYTTRFENGEWSERFVVAPPPDQQFSTDSPSLSADGSNVAYVRRPYPPATGQRAQVVVAGLGTDKTVRTMSTSAEGAPGNGDSTRPTLSPDGRVVGFISTATNLTADAPGDGPQLHARTVNDQQGIVRLGPADTSGTAAGLDEHGSLAVFATSKALVDADTNGQSDVYGRAVPGRLTVRPATLDFGSFKHPTTTPLGLQTTIGNAGPGPVTIASVIPAAPFAYQGSCAGQLILAGDTCTAVISFTPDTAGSFTGTLQVQATTSAGDANQTAESALKAVVAEPPPPAPPTSPPPTSSTSPSPPPSASSGPSPDPGSSTPQSSSTPPIPGLSSSPPPAPGPSAPPPGADPPAPPGSPATLGVTPTVARPGRVLEVRGDGFVPGTRVNLTWGAFGPVKSVVVTQSGTLHAYLVVPSSQEGGKRAAVTAAGDTGALLAYTDFLVEQPPLQPPHFNDRS
ncbi:hypothetical protein AB0D66_29395 [Streptomyces sp. NPDC048270]|uniref:hypothetical protein n=1 Tax=Streptomyces sp. NPDC048270 TaxID=3154615 RepID=UPI0033D77D2A